MLIGVFPTCVGVNPLGELRLRRGGRIPHVRGGEPSPAGALTPTMFVFPTCVGVNRMGRHARQRSECIPHVRGGEPRSPW